MQTIKNYIQILPHIGTSGQPTAEQLGIIAKAGYGAVINLAMPEHDASFDNEGGIVSRLGMQYFHIPVPFDAPQKEHVRLFCNLMDALQGTQVWAHCILNYRVSAFMYHYLSKVEGFDKEKAMSPIFQEWTPDEIWQQILSLTAVEIGLCS